jgi:hypothetical protein
MAKRAKKKAPKKNAPKKKAGTSRARATKPKRQAVRRTTESAGEGPGSSGSKAW